MKCIYSRGVLEHIFIEIATWANADLSSQQCFDSLYFHIIENNKFSMKKLSNSYSDFRRFEYIFVFFPILQNDVVSLKSKAKKKHKTRHFIERSYQMRWFIKHKRLAQKLERERRKENEETKFTCFSPIYSLPKCGYVTFAIDKTTARFFHVIIDIENQRPLATTT